MRTSFLIVLLLLSSFAFAQWPVVIEHPPGWQLLYPHVGLGSNGEALVAASVPTNGEDVRVFSVASDGQIEWQGGYDEPYDQIPQAIADDGHGGCVVLVEEIVRYQPSPVRRLKLVRFDSTGTFVYFALVADTIMFGFYSDESLHAIHGMACVAWFESTGDSEQVRLQRVEISTGIPQEGLRGRLLMSTAGVGTGAGVGTAATETDWIVASGDTLCRFRPEDGVLLAGLHRHWTGESLVIPTQDGVILVGNTTADTIEVQRYDSLGFIGSAAFHITLTLPFAFQAVEYGGGVLIAYSLDTDLFYRIYMPTNCLSVEFPAIAHPRAVLGLRLLHGDRATVAAFGGFSGVYVQQFRADSVRWPDGYQIGSADLDPTFPMDACSGNAYGWVCWKGPDANLYVQPGDSVQPNAIAILDLPKATDFALYPAHPNPFNPTTTLSFTLPKAGRTSIVVYDLLGRKVADLADGMFNSGEHRINFNGSSLPSGLYFARLQSGEFSATQKLLLLK